MKVLHCAEQVVHHCLDVLDLEVDRTLNDFFQIALCKLENYIDAVEMLRVLGLQHVIDPDDIRMLKFAE
jgi:hypothetical protein